MSGFNGWELFFGRGLSRCSSLYARLTDEPLFFDGGVGKFSHANLFFLYALLLQTIFEGVLVFLQTLFFFYLHTIYFSVYSLCKQFISNFSNPPSPVKK